MAPWISIAPLLPLTGPLGSYDLLNLSLSVFTLRKRLPSLA
jgi:hypothetical protein